ncbi:MAG: hypothetical protein NTU44_20460 [Bacteroidetes bacterium]|nr:hypothetical protein [Bacteroidota bacterium]
MKKFLLTSLVVMTFGYYAGAQHYRIDYRYDTIHQVIPVLKTVIFSDIDKKIAVGTIDVAAFNPFGNLPFPVNDDLTSERGMKVYDMRGLKLKDVLPGKVLTKFGIPQADILTLPVGYFDIVDYKRPDYAVLNYRFYACSTTEPRLTYSKLWIYKPDGTELFNLLDNDANVIDIDIDQAGTYLCFSFGLTVADTTWLKEGFKIFNIQDKSKYFELNGESYGFHFFFPGMLNVLYPAEKGVNQTDTWVKVFDCKKSRIYLKRYTKSQMLNIDSFMPEGILFKGGAMDYFEKDFSGEDMKWNHWEKKAE